MAVSLGLWFIRIDIENKDYHLQFEYKGCDSSFIISVLYIQKVVDKSSFLTSRSGHRLLKALV